MKISLVICAYNEEKYIEACLDSVLKNAKEKLLEIIVVDNNSTDKTKEIVNRFSWVNLVEETKKGTNNARQKGFVASTGEIVAFIDADTHVPEGWIDIVIDEFSKNPKLGCLSGPYIYYDFSKWEQFLSLIYWYIFAYPAYLIVGYMAAGGNLVMSRKVISASGGFDTSVKFYGDDTSISREASRFGKVKFKLNFIMYSSARRLKGQGILKTVFIYVTNFFSQVFIKRSVTTTSEDIR